jgi:hypothetical protein
MQTLENPKNALLMLRRNANAVILHPQPHPMGLGICPNFNLGLPPCRHKLQRIHQEIGENLHEGDAMTYDA